MEDKVKLQIRDGVGIVILNRPKNYNAFDPDMVKTLATVLSDIAVDKSVKGTVITGTGKAFCAGGDLMAISSYGKSYGEAFHGLAGFFHQAILEIRRMPKPVVAALNGLAAGGGFSMALACDFRIMEKSAVMKQAYTSNGLSIDGGGTFTLPRIVGLARAMEIAAFDPVITAEKAFQWGLVTEVVDDGQSLERACNLVIELSKGAISSFAASKSLFTDSFNTSFETQLERERTSLSACADHPNGKEGISAFLEKRKPRFTVSLAE